MERVRNLQHECAGRKAEIVEELKSRPKSEFIMLFQHAMKSFGETT